MSQLKGVAIGAGYFSQFHFDAWSRLDNVSLTAICDLERAKAEEAASQHSVSASYDNFGTMLAAERPDFVDIITRPDSHLDLVREAASRGIAIICQKPLAPTFEEAKELVAVVEEAGVPLMVHENFRFQPWYREIGKMLETDAIGDRLHSIQIRTRTGDGWQPDAYLARQPYFREMERFLVFETGVHFIDTLRFLAGEISGVYASLRRLNPEIAGEDAGTLLFEHENGAASIWDANRFNETNADDPRYTFGEALVEGSGGSIRLYADGRLTRQPLGGKEEEHRYGHEHRNFASDCVLATQRHFIDCLVEKKPFETSGTEYLKTLAVQEAVYASAKSGQPVRGLSGQPS